MRAASGPQEGAGRAQQPQRRQRCQSTSHHRRFSTRPPPPSAAACRPCSRSRSPPRSSPRPRPWLVAIAATSPDRARCTIALLLLPAVPSRARARVGLGRVARPGASRIGAPGPRVDGARFCSSQLVAGRARSLRTVVRLR